jgi:hypothetical protein
MTGLCGSPTWGADPNVVSSLEFYYIKLSDVMIGADSFNWSPLDSRLQATAARKRHAIFRFYVHYPGTPSAVPSYLTIPYIGDEPDYNAPALQAAFQKFIQRLGERYDGDKRIAFIQAGLIGKWYVGL